MANSLCSLRSRICGMIIVTLFVLLQDVECKSREESVLSYLVHFNTTRNNHVIPATKTAARDYIVKTFRDHGLDTWTEEFPSNQNDYPGINVIGRVSGRYTGTSQDKILVIASHYDTVAGTNGVDDNGSGMTVQLQAIKQYLSPDNLRCTQNFTLLVVAFDLEEVQTGCGNSSCSCGGALCGSDFFVKNLSRYLNQTGGELQGAYVMDSVMNYNTTPHSQVLPSGFDILFNKQYNAISANQFRGDFLTVIGRQTDDEVLRRQLISNYPNTDKFKVLDVPLPFSGRPSNISSAQRNGLSDFMRSDHKRFWDNAKSWPAVFLTGTANFRGYMTTCYHRLCDDMDHVTPGMIISMGKTAEALVGAAKSMVQRVCTLKSEACGTTQVKVNEASISSPYHPSSYPNGINCTWLRESEYEQTLSFVSWDLEESTNCTNDYVEIRDGREPADPLIGRYCGKTKPGTLKLAPSNKVISVHFHSDAFDVYKGFKISWNTSVYSGVTTVATQAPLFTVILAAVTSLLMKSHL